jgi:hypothetical protein
MAGEAWGEHGSARAEGELTGFSGGVEAEHQEPHLLVAKDLAWRAGVSRGGQ